MNRSTTTREGNETSDSIGRILTAVAFLAVFGCSVDGPGASQPDGGAGLSQLDGESYALQVDRIARNPDVQFPFEALEETDYERVEDGNLYDLSFSEDGKTVSVAGPSPGEAPLIMTGGIAVDTEDFRRYAIEEGLFAGGRFNVWIDDDHFEAELTVYGSGIPIVRSERGRLLAVN